MTKCTICKSNESVYARFFSGEQLCGNCFLGSIQNKVKATIAKNKMFDIDDRIAIAVSGGKDSVSLVHILTQIEHAFPKTSISAITIDEGIEGYRKEATKIAAENCAKLGVRHTVVAFKNLFGYTLDEIVEKTKDAKLTPCAYCGVLRRRALNIAGQQVGAAKIATAHNMDDEIQTFLLNVVHGDPLRIGRSGHSHSLEKSGLVRRVKPLSEVPEKEIALYAFLKHVRFQEIPCPYAGQALRNDTRNMLNRLEEKHPGVKYTVYRSMEKIRESIEKASVRIPLQKCRRCGHATTREICQTCEILENL